MKKLVGAMAVVLLLGGCSLFGGESEEETSDTTATVETSETAETTDTTETTESSVEDTTSSETGSTSEEITFVPQQSDIDAGFTLENDEALRLLDEMVRNPGGYELGIANDVAIHFTGLYLNDADAVRAIFIIVNRTGVAMTNINMAISFATSDNRPILEEYLIGLTEETFGILEPNTAMPLYVAIPAENEELLYELIDTRNEIISIDSFTYETVD